jgi:predicted transcriptional regulator
MKNKKALRVKFKSLEQLKQELLNLPEAKKGYLQPKEIVLFESLNSFRNFMTLQKLELLTLISSVKPKSIYELAKMVDRAIVSVQKDCNVLERSGFIVFEKTKGGRGNLAPRLKFNYDRIIVDRAEYPYELVFKSVA